MTNGAIRAVTDGKPAMTFESRGKMRIIDINDIPFEGIRKPGFIKGIINAKHFANRLKEQGFTLEIRLDGFPVVRMGKLADSKLSKIIMQSRHLQIIDYKKLQRLNKMM